MEQNLSSRTVVVESAAGTPKSISLSSGSLAILSSTDEVVVVQDSAYGVPPYRRRFDWPTRYVKLSPSGRFLAVGSTQHRYVEVWDIHRDQQVLRIGGMAERGGSVSVGLMRFQGEEIAIYCHDRYVLEASTLTSPRRLFQCPLTRPLQFRSEYIMPLADEDTVGLIGRYEGESDLSLLAPSLTGLMADPESDAQVMTRRNSVIDEAAHLAIGPCGPEHIVVYRDPEDAEAPEDASEGDRDVYGFKGLYVREIGSLRLVQSIPYACSTDLWKIDDNIHVFGNERIIAMVGADRLHVVPQDHERGEAEVIPARIAALDPQANEAAVVTTDGLIRFIGLPT